MPALVDSTGKTSKTNLITALATSLQKEKIRSSKLCKELEITEEKVSIDAVGRDCGILIAQLHFCGVEINILAKLSTSSFNLV